MTDILILGGGFGGLACANRLRGELGDEHSITVVDRRDRFTVGAAKLWHVVGLRDLDASSRALSGLGRKGIEFVQAEIASIDPAARSVETSEGTLTGDHLVVALGAAFAPKHLGGLQPPAFNLYDPVFIPDIAVSLAALKEGRIVIAVMGVPYKCPPAPYEAAFLIDEHLRETGRRDDIEIDVYTVQPSPLPVAGEVASARVSAALAERRIGLHPEHKGIVVDPVARTARFENGAEAAFDLFLGVPAHVPPAVVRESALAGENGWIEPDRATLATRFEGVYAMGDCVAIPNAVGEVPKAGVFAEAEGLVVAGQILASIDSREAPTFDGHGYCFLEFAGGRAAKVEGDFLAAPKPDVTFTDPDAETFEAKQRFVSERLEAWL